MLAIGFEAIDRLGAPDALFQMLEVFVFESRAEVADLLKQRDALFQHLDRLISMPFKLHHFDDQAMPLLEVLDLFAELIGEVLRIARHAFNSLGQRFALIRRFRFIARVVP